MYLYLYQCYNTMLWVYVIMVINNYVTLLWVYPYLALITQTFCYLRPNTSLQAYNEGSPSRRPLKIPMRLGRTVSTLRSRRGISHKIQTQKLLGLRTLSMCTGRSLVSVAWDSSRAADQDSIVKGPSDWPYQWQGGLTIISTPYISVIHLKQSNNCVDFRTTDFSYVIFWDAADQDSIVKGPSEVDADKCFSIFALKAGNFSVVNYYHY